MVTNEDPPVHAAPDVASDPILRLHERWSPVGASVARVHVVDALRGFALLGIALLHSVEHFDIVERTPVAYARPAMDEIVARAAFLVFEGKAYAMFAFLFGFSFFIQLSNGYRRGVDFRWRFAWRLVILGIFGYVHTLFYAGDVLTIFAAFGLPLVFLYHAPNKVLIGIAVLFLLQVPELISLFGSLATPGPAQIANWGRWDEGMAIWAHGSFRDVLFFNAGPGHVLKWLFMLNTGRYLQMAGLIVLGLVIGRSRYFENVSDHARATRRVLFIALPAWAVLHYLHKALPVFDMAENQRASLLFLTKSWSDLAGTAILISGFVLAYARFANPDKRSVLATYGRMSLTNYVTQGLVGTIVFYGYGLAMHAQWGAALSLCFGLVLFGAQALVSWYWSDHFRQGPLEWVWRKLTMLPFRRRSMILAPSTALTHAEN